LESEERISDEARRLLQLIANNIKKDFGTSNYLFPSKQGRQFSHIRTVEHFWKKILKELDIKY